MRREDRLGALRMRVRGKDDIEVRVATAEECGLEVEQAPVDRFDRIPGPKTQIGRDLVVPAPGRMQFAADVPDQFDQGVLDVHVDVFEFDVEREGTVLDAATNREETRLNPFQFVVGKQADRTEHRRMGQGAANILFVQAAVETDAFGETFDPVVRRLGEDAPPGFTGTGRRLCVVAVFGHGMTSVLTGMRSRQ